MDEFEFPVFVFVEEAHKFIPYQGTHAVQLES